jgi:hypothetical protein
MTIMTRLVSRLWRLPPAENAARVERGATALLTDIYHPQGLVQPPTVLMRSPYGRGHIIGIFGRLFAERGYTTDLTDLDRGVAATPRDVLVRLRIVDSSKR